MFWQTFEEGQKDEIVTEEGDVQAPELIVI